jgi:hypothetical protein
MIAEPCANDDLEEKLDLVGSVFYDAPTLICTPAPLDREIGLALGAQAGEARSTDVLTQGGFTRAPWTEAPLNLILEARPQTRPIPRMAGPASPLWVASRLLAPHGSRDRAGVGSHEAQLAAEFGPEAVEEEARR